MVLTAATRAGGARQSMKRKRCLQSWALRLHSGISGSPAQPEQRMRLTGLAALADG